MHLRLDTGDRALALLDDRWDALLARQPRPNPLLCATWLRELARWQTGTPLVAVVEDGDRIVAGVALELHHGGRVATWLGPEEQQVSPDALCEPGQEDAAAELLRGVLGEAPVLSLAVLSPGVAASALARVTPWAQREVTSPRWVTPLPPTRRPYAERRADRYVRRVAGRGVQVEWRVLAEPADVAPALVRLFRFHREIWRDRPWGAQRFATSRAHRRWNLHAVEQLAAAGHVRVVELLENGRVVGGGLQFVFGTGAIGHTLATHPQAELECPGHALLLHGLDAVCAAGATWCDLGPSTAHPGSPKARLGCSPEPIERVLAAASPSRQHLIGAAYELRRLAGQGRRVKPPRQVMVRTGRLPIGTLTG